MIDYHTHILPHMDDGAANADMSAAMIAAAQQQGAKKIVLTPHFYVEEETPDQFLSRREQALAELMASPAAPTFPPLYVGAEVRLARDLSDCQGLDRLCIQGTRLLLLEFPYQAHADWMVPELENITYRFHIQPIIAHLDRYVAWHLLRHGDLDRILAFDEALIQVNAEALDSRGTRKLVRDLIRNDYPVLFGSDTHNMADRAPNLDHFTDLLRKTGYQEPDYLP